MSRRSPIGLLVSLSIVGQAIGYAMLGVWGVYCVARDRLAPALRRDIAVMFPNHKPIQGVIMPNRRNFLKALGGIAGALALPRGQAEAGAPTEGYLGTLRGVEYVGEDDGAEELGRLIAGHHDRLVQLQYDEYTHMVFSPPERLDSEQLLTEIFRDFHFFQPDYEAYKDG
jgi:hypothetical protein